MQFLTDENFDSRIFKGLLQQQPDLDLLRVQDVRLSNTADPLILEWAAQNGYILLTHDVKTMIGYAYERVAWGLPMAGICVVRQDEDVGMLVEDLLILIECTRAEDWPNQVHYIPI